MEFVFFLRALGPNVIPQLQLAPAHEASQLALWQSLSLDVVVSLQYPRDAHIVGQLYLAVQMPEYMSCPWLGFTLLGERFRLHLKCISLAASEFYHPTCFSVDSLFIELTQLVATNDSPRYQYLLDSFSRPL